MTGSASSHRWQRLENTSLMAMIEIIAEVANAHQGDPEKAIALAKAAIVAGADAVKFQVYSADELLVRSHPRYEHFRQQSFNATTWLKVFSAFTSLDAKIYADIYGFDALEICRRADIYGYKIHSSDLANTPLLEAAAADGKPMLLAVGGSTVREIEGALGAVANLKAPVTLLHGFQSYPTAVKDAGLGRLLFLAGQFGPRVRIGYADHVAGDDSFAFTLPAMAIAMGARVIEKHISFDRLAHGVDWYSSLEPGEFGQFVEEMHEAAAALDTEPLHFAEPERDYRRAIKKHWVARRDLPSGHKLAGNNDLIMKRIAELDVEPVELQKLDGRILVRSLTEEELINRNMVANTVWACVIARMRSVRLPGKALIDVAGMPAIVHLLRRVRQIPGLSGLVLCTTIAPEDDAIAVTGEQEGIPVHRGPVLDVLGRMLGALEVRNADVALRITGDDILIDPDYAAAAIRHHLEHNAEYTDLKQLPSGTEIEVFDVDLLHTLWNSVRDRNGTEYLTTYVTANRDQFRTATCPVAPQHARAWRLTLDTPEDLAVIRALLEAMRKKGKALDYRLDDIVDFLERNPGILALNSNVRQRVAPAEVSVDLDWSRMGGFAT